MIASATEGAKKRRRISPVPAELDGSADSSSSDTESTDSLSDSEPELSTESVSVHTALRELLLKHTDDFTRLAEDEVRALLKKLEDDDPNRLVIMAKERVRLERKKKRRFEKRTGKVKKDLYAALAGTEKSWVVVTRVLVREDQHSEYELRPTCKGCIEVMRNHDLFKAREGPGRPKGKRVHRTEASFVCPCEGVAITQGIERDGSSAHVGSCFS